MNIIRFPQPAEAAQRLLDRARREDKKVVYRRFGRPCNPPRGDGPDDGGNGGRAA